MVKIKDICRDSARKFAVGLGGLLLAMVPLTALADIPEIDCESLSQEQKNVFYNFVGECSNALGDKNFDSALANCSKAMEMCTTDVYTEYSLARIYQLTNDCPNAFYHFERLMNRPASVQKNKDNVDIYKEVKKYFKDVKAKCGDVVSLEINCETPGSELTIDGLGSVTAYSCPFFAKVKPGSYPVVVHKEGYQSRNETVNAAESVGAVLNIPALKEVSRLVDVRIQCPLHSTKFFLTAADGTTETLQCPYPGKLEPGTYTIRLSESDPSDSTTIVIEENQKFEYMIPNVAKSNCSAAPLNSSTAPVAGGIFALLGLLGLGAIRRRRSE